jgi:hypothetical protein
LAKKITAEKPERNSGAKNMEQEKSNSAEAQSIRAQTFGIFCAGMPRAEKGRFGFRGRGGETRLC